MAAPTAPTQQYDFEDYSTSNPTDQQPGDKLDAEFAHHRGRIADIVDFVRTQIGDDGYLKGGSIDVDQIGSDVLALLNTNLNFLGAWVTATDYALSDVVQVDGASYVCIVAHTSGAFATDFTTNSYWQIFASPESVDATVLADRLSGDGTTGPFTLSENMGTDENILFVFDHNGNIMDPVTDYTVSGTSLTFSANTTVGTNNYQVRAMAYGVNAAQTAAETAQSAAEAAQAAAETAETNAAASAGAASTSASNASTSETNAAASAAAAAASADKILFNDVTYITNSDSPYTLATTQDGELISVDTSGGAVTVNLPSIATAGNGWRITIKKSTGDGNAVTVTPNGTDTINLGASDTLGVSGSAATYTGDIDLSPDDWASVSFGGGAGDMTVDTLTDGVDFTAGSSTTVTLSTAPGSENNVQIFFDGVFQHHSTYTVSNVTVTFDAAIPAGVGEVEAVTGTTLSVGTPADGTVTSAKLSGDLTVPGDLTVTDNFIMDVGTVTASTTQTQAGGQALTTDNVLISTCANQGDSVVLPSAAAGRSVWITNSGAEAAWVWPASGDAINEGTTDARDPVPLWPKESREYRAHDATGFYTPRPAGSRVLLDTQTASTSSSLDFTTGIDGTYDVYELELVNILLDTTAQPLKLLFSDDGGSTFETSAYYWAAKAADSAGSDDDTAANNDDELRIAAAGTSNASEGGVCSLVRIFNPAATDRYTKVTALSSFSDNGGNSVAWSMGGDWKSVAAVNGFRLISTSGNLTSGAINLYGIVK